MSSQIVELDGQRLFIPNWPASVIHNGDSSQIFETNDSNYLIKVWYPPLGLDSGNSAKAIIEGERAEVARRYSTFCNTLIHREQELSCLPKAYIVIDGRPAYVMQRALGTDLSDPDGWGKLISLDLVGRMQVAMKLAAALSQLHSHSVVHADIKRDNIVWNSESHEVRLLDVDGGGYWGSAPNTYQIAPSVVPGDVFRAPEISMNNLSWLTVWAEPARRRQPDLWALAVLIYYIVVKETPFHSRYFPAGAEQKREVAWPANEQYLLWKDIGLAWPLFEGFRELFCVENRLRIDHRRIPASEWCERIRVAIEHHLTTKRAHEIYEARTTQGADGSATSDWLQAEKEVQATSRASRRGSRSVDNRAIYALRFWQLVALTNCAKSPNHGWTLAESAGYSKRACAGVKALARIYFASGQQRYLHVIEKHAPNIYNELCLCECHRGLQTDDHGCRCCATYSEACFCSCHYCESCDDEESLCEGGPTCQCDCHSEYTSCANCADVCYCQCHGCDTCKSEGGRLICEEECDCGCHECCADCSARIRHFGTENW